MWISKKKLREIISKELSEHISEQVSAEVKNIDFDDTIMSFFQNYYKGKALKTLDFYWDDKHLYSYFRFLFQTQLDEMFDKELKNMDNILNNIAQEKWTNEYVNKVSEKEIRKAFEKKYAEIAQQQAEIIASKLWGR